MPQSPSWWKREFDINPIGLVRLVLFWLGVLGFTFALLIGVLQGDVSPWRAIAFISACALGVYLIWRIYRTRIGGMFLAGLTLVALAFGALLRITGARSWVCERPNCLSG
jgi:hypothetical protein